ncbi:hypothetical protein GCM10023189_23100 [Nibrella saemangeumensis]|uniref:FHA domain-containing protein n=1 Tax=Nibrella saemangeumensis TaxID=1084526 RepID=A0ABP8MW30_9BACT
MFNLFNKKAESRPKDVKAVRDTLLRFIKEQLQKAEGGEGHAIKGLQLYIAPPADEQHLYEAAVYQADEGRFKAEVQKIADDFAINLPEGWTFETTFVDSLPAEGRKIPGLDASLYINTRIASMQKLATAYIRILNGEAEKEEYVLTSTGGKVNIGREKRVQQADGFFRVNTIAFPADSPHESNKFISRQHAHIEWDPESASFMFFADEGGVPPRNKIKVRAAIDEQPVKLHSTQVGHRLQEGDQIILGESAVLEFSYTKE